MGMFCVNALNRASSVSTQMFNKWLVKNGCVNALNRASSVSTSSKQQRAND